MIKTPRQALPVATLIGLLGSFQLSAHGQTAVTVPTLKVQTQQVAMQYEWDGVIEPVRQSTVAAQVPGNITALLVKAGDSVKAGQPLARIDDREVQAGVSRSQADVAQAEAQLENARLQWQRSQSLHAQGFISAAALDSANAQWKAAQAAAAAAKAGRTQATLARDFSTVIAPFDGKVLSTQAQVGDLAAPGRPILTIYAPKPLRAVVQVPASQADGVRQSSSAMVQLPGPNLSSPGQWIKPTHVIALPGADPVSQTVEWRLDLPDVNVLPGQTVRIRFAGSVQAQGNASAAAQLLTVPGTAVLRRGELTGVYVVRDGRFALQAIRTSTPANANGPVTVLSGIRSGDVIATDALKAGLLNALPAKP